MEKPKSYYAMVHVWLNKKYGKATKCENPRCSNKSETYEYALKTGCSHKRDRGNYLTLCRSCHRVYDMTPEKAIKSSSHIAGKYNVYLKLGPKSKERKIMLVKENKEFNSGKDLSEYLGVHKSGIYMAANGQRKTIKGHTVKWI